MQVLFGQEEVKSVRGLFEPGIEVLGFKSRRLLQDHHNVSCVCACVCACVRARACVCCARLRGLQADDGQVVIAKARQRHIGNWH